MRAMKIEGNMNRGGRRDYTCDHGLSRRSWKLDVCEEKKEKEKKNVLEVMFSDEILSSSR